MMEATRTSETLVNFHQTTRRNLLHDSHLHTRCRENLTSHLISSRFLWIVTLRGLVGRKQSFGITQPSCSSVFVVSDYRLEERV